MLYVTVHEYYPMQSIVHEYIPRVYSIAYKHSQSSTPRLKQTHNELPIYRSLLSGQQMVQGGGPFTVLTCMDGPKLQMSYMTSLKLGFIACIMASKFLLPSKWHSNSTHLHNCYVTVFWYCRAIVSTWKLVQM